LLHSDCCLGGYILPFMKKLGYNIPNFDFSIPEVTSISIDTHKYGMSAKGSSVILFKNKDLRKHMYFSTTEWPGGLYASPSIAGSRSGGLIASTWAAIVSIGEKGYLEMAKGIGETHTKLKEGIPKINGLYVVGNPEGPVIAFGSHDFDVYRVVDAAKKKGWNWDCMINPPCVHICITSNHIGLGDQILVDLKVAVEIVKTTPAEKTGVAPIYGAAATIPDRSIITEMLTCYLDECLSV